MESAAGGRRSSIESNWKLKSGNRFQEYGICIFSTSMWRERRAGGALNTFVRTRQVVRITRQWCEAGRESAWAFCIEYADGATPAAGGSGAAGRVDYREVLPPEQFVVFARLRTARKVMADREGQAVFAVFTNAQLAEMVRRRCVTIEELKGIPGIGEARAAKYGAEMLTALHEGGAEA